MRFLRNIAENQENGHGARNAAVKFVVIIGLVTSSLIQVILPDLSQIICDQTAKENQYEYAKLLRQRGRVNDMVKSKWPECLDSIDWDSIDIDGVIDDC